MIHKQPQAGAIAAGLLVVMPMYYKMMLTKSNRLTAYWHPGRARLEIETGGAVTSSRGEAIVCDETGAGGAAKINVIAPWQEGRVIIGREMWTAPFMQSYGALFLRYEEGRWGFDTFRSFRTIGASGCP